MYHTKDVKNATHYLLALNLIYIVRVGENLYRPITAECAECGTAAAQGQILDVTITGTFNFTLSVAFMVANSSSKEALAATAINMACAVNEHHARSGARAHLT